MEKRKIRMIVLCLALAAVFLCGWLITGRRTDESETENTDLFVTSDGIVYGKVSAVGKETLTIQLGTLETQEDRLKLAGREVTIRTKEETVVECMRTESIQGAQEAEESPAGEEDIAMEDLAEGDVVSIALDEEGYAETITLMDYSAVGADDRNG